jgi:hypothetical protein
MIVRPSFFLNLFLVLKGSDGLLFTLILHPTVFIVALVKFISFFGWRSLLVKKMVKLSLA